MWFEMALCCVAEKRKLRISVKEKEMGHAWSDNTRLVLQTMSCQSRQRAADCRVEGDNDSVVSL